MPESAAASPNPTRILVVDDEESMRHMLTTILGREGYTVEAAGDAESALKHLSEEPADLVITDVRMPGNVDGIALVDRIKQEGHEAAVIVMSAYGSMDLAREAIRKGAWDYVNKPFTADDVLLVVAKAMEHARLRLENRLLKASLRDPQGPGGLVGKSPAMQAVFAAISRVASVKSTVLITGESGTGKELVARAIHQESARREKPFVPVSCAAIPETLIESELFGHAKGAFTGAVAAKKGLAEEAAGGTLFLDEIGELPLSVQVKLLRLLQEDEVRRLGENKTLKVDVRVVAATLRDLTVEVKEGRFREDLYYRLNVLEIKVPALRDRREDIPLLVEHFLAKLGKGKAAIVRAVSPAAMARLTAYDWNGNVRELENTLERAVVLASGPELRVEDLPPKLTRPAPAATEAEGDHLMAFTGGSLSVKKAFERLERELIRRALEATDGNRTRAAEILELSPRALLYKIRDYGLE